jgi:hypothetical protein
MMMMMIIIIIIIIIIKEHFDSRILRRQSHSNKGGFSSG